MIVTVARECGYEEALVGMSLSYYDRSLPLEEWWTKEKFERAERVAKALSFKGLGHSKFLESIQVWIYVQASRSFWVEMDTYRVGMSKQSASTLHTLDKRPVKLTDFEDGTNLSMINGFNTCLEQYKDPSHAFYKDVTALKENLPEGWLQERMLCTNYKCLQNIVAQRAGHRLKHWRTFIEALQEQLEHPEFIFNYQ